MKKAKTKNFNLPTTAASRHTTPLRGYFLSSRFICEATNHSSSRFSYEATGDSNAPPFFKVFFGTGIIIEDTIFMEISPMKIDSPAIPSLLSPSNWLVK